jgi:hypothetical protein
VRRHDWASRMFSVFDEHHHRPFDLSAGGCWPFVARVVDAMTGSDYEARLSEAYGNGAAVLRLMAQPGGVAAAVADILGPPSEGRPIRGDVILFDGGEGDAVGIWDGASIIAMGEAGLHRVPRSEIKAFWSIR